MTWTPQRVWRLARRAVFAVAALGGAYMIVRFGFESIPDGYTLLEPEIPPGSTALVDRKYRWSRPLAEEDIVSFRIATASGPAKRYGRVAGLAGSRIETDGPDLRIDGARTDYPPPRGLELPAEIPGGHVLVAFNAAQVEGPAALESAIVSEEAVLARVLLAVSGRE